MEKKTAVKGNKKLATTKIDKKVQPLMRSLRSTGKPSA
jgi:hypothetical protein